jgi:hypothetical protein
MGLDKFVPPIGSMAAFVAALVTALLTQAQTAPPAETGLMSPEAVAAQPQSSVLSLPASSDYDRSFDAFSARPLLAEGRRPHMPAAAPTESEPIASSEPMPADPAPMEVVAPPPPSVTLLGTMNQAGGWRALLRDNEIGSEEWTAVGSQISGWIVSSVQPESVTLQLQDAEITLHMFEN